MYLLSTAVLTVCSVHEMSNSLHLLSQSGRMSLILLRVTDKKLNTVALF